MRIAWAPPQLALDAAPQCGPAAFAAPPILPRRVVSWTPAPPSLVVVDFAWWPVRAPGSTKSTAPDTRGKSVFVVRRLLPRAILLRGANPSPVTPIWNLHPIPKSHDR